ncbi:MAG: LysE family translocator [Alphaproteobacteria bacterium]|nr:LysE family translocator [Alphaproteobacteria bacterium]
MSPDFLATSFLVVLMPGTGVLYTVSVALGRGFPAYGVAAAGCTLGITPHIALSLSGAAAVLAADPVAFTALKVLGVCYLLYMAVSALRATGSLQVAPRAEAAAAVRTVADGVFLNLLNPKLSVFFLAFLPQFVDPSASGALQQMALLSAVFMAMTFLVFCVYGAAADWTRRRLLGDGRAMTALRWLFAAAFAGLAVRLATASL